MKECLKDKITIMNETPLICGEFNSEGDVARYIYDSRHSILLSGVLIFAYKGNEGSVKSLVISSNNSNKFMISIFYDNYNMMYTSMILPSLPDLLEELSSDKKLKDLVENLKLRFYERC